MLHYDDDCDGELYPPAPCCHNQQPHLIWIPSVKYGKPITPTTNHLIKCLLGAPPGFPLSFPYNPLQLERKRGIFTHFDFTTFCFRVKDVERIVKVCMYYTGRSVNTFIHTLTYLILPLASCILLLKIISMF
jgi:hypothetical protein